MQLFSQRLTLRPWTEADKQPFAKMSSHAEVMSYLRPLPTRAACDRWIDFQNAHQLSQGFCLWAVELNTSGTFIGAAGLLRVDFAAHFTPAVEIGWRLARPFWGQGYATEAAEEALRFGFYELHLPEIVAHASVHNARSKRVMTKLGMRYNPADDFDHPRIPERDPLRRQVLYRLTRHS